MATIHPICGEFREHRWIMQQIKKALQDKKFSLLVIFPTLSLLRHIQNELLNEPGVNGLGGIRFLLFEGFIQEIGERFTLAQSAPSPLIRDLMLTEVFESLKKQGKINYLARASFNTGYREAILAGMAEWKRSCLTPETFLAWASSKGEKEQQLALLYQSFQELLIKSGFCEEDAILDKLQRIKEQIRMQPERPLAILYGFTDLTPLQNRFIEVLSEWFDFEIILDPTPAEEIRHFIARRFAYRHLPEMPISCGDNALGWLQASFGANPTPLYSKSPDDTTLQVLQTAGSSKQNMAIALQIVTILHENPGCSMDDFLILSPHPQEFMKTARPIFTEYQLALPPSGMKVSEFPGPNHFSQALTIGDSDWQWPEMEVFIRQQYAGDKAGVGDRVLVELGDRYGALSGKKRWLGVLQKDWLSYSLEIGLDTLPLQQGLTLLESIPQTATLKEYLEIVVRYLNETQKDAIGSSLRGEIDFHLQLGNLTAIQQAAATIEEVTASIDLLPSLRTEMSLADFRNFWAHILTSEIKGKTPAGSFVKVMIPQEARGLSAKFVFITGLEQGSFPRYYINDWKLSLRERLELQTLGVDLETGEEYQTKEKMAFYWALQTARERLYLVYQTQDSSGQPLNPSSFLEEIWQYCPELFKQAKTYPLALEPPPSLTGCYSSFEKGSYLAAHLMAATSELSETEKIDCLELLQKPLYQQLAKQIWQESGWRLQGRSLFSKDESHQLIARTFGAAHIFAITSLEDYHTCPYRFFLKQMLGVKPFLRPQMLPDNLDLGNLYHQVLQDFAERYRGQSLISKDREEYHNFLRECFHSFYREWLQNAANDLVKLVLKLQEAQIWNTLQRWLRTELDWAEKTNGRFKISFLEFGFGLVRGDFDPASLDRPYQLVAEEIPIQIWGKVDRIDADGEGGFIVYDYKSGRGPATKEILSANYYQIPVYLMALEDLYYGEGKAVGGSYLGLKEPSRSRGGVWHSDRLRLRLGGKSLLGEKEWQDWLSTVRDSLAASVQAIRRGDFFPNSEDCPAFCEFQTCCRRDERESEVKDETSAE